MPIDISPLYQGRLAVGALEKCLTKLVLELLPEVSAMSKETREELIGVMKKLDGRDTQTPHKNM